MSRVLKPGKGEQMIEKLIRGEHPTAGPANAEPPEQPCALDPVDPDDPNYVGFLYGMLMMREPHMNISHRSMPLYVDHWTYIKESTHWWWLISPPWFGKDCALPWIGNCYLTRRGEVGIFLMAEYRGQGFGKNVLAQLEDWWAREGNGQPILANIAKANDYSQAWFEKRGYGLLQRTFEKHLVPPDPKTSLRGA